MTLKAAWTLADGAEPGEIVAFPGRGQECRTRPRYILKSAAVELIRRGTITTGMFARWPGRFMRRLEREGIRAVPELWGPLKQVRFEVAQ